METAVYHNDTCRICGGHDLKLGLQMPETPIGDAFFPKERAHESRETYPLDVYICNDCGLSQLVHVVDPELLYGNYLYESTTSPGLVKHFQGYADDVMNRIQPPREAFVVEIGSNDGTLLRFLKGHGLRVLGVDPARDIARRATESGIETLPEYLTTELAEKIKREQGPAQIIIANNVMANVDNLTELVTGIRTLLAPDGVLLVETGYVFDLIQNNVFDNVFHEHLFYYSVHTLRQLFKRHGMELIHVDHVNTKGGSMRVTVQLEGGSRQKTRSVDQTIAIEDKVGVNRVDAFNAMKARVDAEKEKLTQLLSDLQKQGKTIAGYCASHTVTTFLYYFGIDRHLNFIVDDNVIKQNTFSPGHHIPVYSPEKIYEKTPDYIVILAWRFYEGIVANHQRYLDQGGHFIVPLPSLRVI